MRKVIIVGRLEIIAFVIGFCLLAYELAAARLLAPFIGSSVYVWTSVIGVIILALSLGYACGGWLADKRVKQVDVALLLLAAAAGTSLTLLTYNNVLEAIVTAIADPRLQGLLSSLILFAPTSFVLGSISPYLARLKLKSITTTGRVIAGLSAVNSLGGIAGTLITGFILFGYFGTNQILVFLVVGLVALSWMIAPGRRRLERVVVSISAVGAAIFGLNPPLAHAVLADIDTPSAHYQVQEVTDDPRGAYRTLVSGPGARQSGSFVSGSSELVFWYTQTMADIAELAPRHDTILILGGGAFSLPRSLSERYPNAQITVVEIDPELPAISEKYFYYEPPKNVKVVAEDARTFLNRNEKAYDIVMVDAFSNTSIPFSLTTKEYAAALGKAVAPSGQVVVNLIASTKGACSELWAGIDNSYKSAFGYGVYFLRYPDSPEARQNIIAAYSNQPLTWLDQERAITAVPKHRHIFTDDFTPVDRLNFECALQS